VLDEEIKARMGLAALHAEHRQDRIKSIAMRLAALPTKALRDAEVKRIKEKYGEAIEKSITAMAKVIYGEKK